MYIFKELKDTTPEELKKSMRMLSRQTENTNKDRDISILKAHVEILGVEKCNN